MNFWKPLSKSTAVCFFPIYICVIWIFSKSAGFVPILDDANLLFHEAGHPIIGWVSARLAVYGGTLGQLMFPLLVLFQFWRQRETLGVVVGGLWLADNLLNIARYMADARDQLLPLIGGGEHDWLEIFSRWDMLPQDQQMATAVRGLAWFIVGSCGMWVLWQVMVQRNVRDSRL